MARLCAAANAASASASARRAASAAGYTRGMGEYGDSGARAPRSTPPFENDGANGDALNAGRGT